MAVDRNLVDTRGAPMDVTAPLPTPPGVTAAARRQKSRKELFEKVKDAVYDFTNGNIDDYDPAVELAKISVDTTIPIDIRAAAHARILPYLHSAKAPIKQEVSINQMIEQNTMVEALVQMMAHIPSGAMQIIPPVVQPAGSEDEQE